MKTPKDKQIAFLFVSHPMKQMSMRWQASLKFPMDASADSILTLAIVDGENKPIDSGVFEFAGLQLPVKNGAASLSYADFIRGKHETSLWLHRPGMSPVPGGLTFG